MYFLNCVWNVKCSQIWLWFVLNRMKILLQNTWFLETSLKMGADPFRKIKANGLAATCHWRHKGGEGIQLYPFLTSVIEGNGLSTPSPCSISQEKSSTHYTGDWVGPRAGLDRYGKEKNLLHPPGFEPRTTLSGSVFARPLSQKSTMNAPRLGARKFCSVINKFHRYVLWKEFIVELTDPTVKFLASIPGRAVVITRCLACGLLMQMVR